MAGRRRRPPAREPARASGWRTIRRVAPYLWPPGDREVKLRVVAAMAALVLGRLAAVVTPFFFKAAVDGLAPADPAAQVGYLVAAGPVALTLFYGLMRLAGRGLHPAPRRRSSRGSARGRCATWRSRPSGTCTRSACATTSRARPAASAGSSSAG